MRDENSLPDGIDSTKTPTEVLMEVLESEDIDQIRSIAIVYEKGQDKDGCVETIVKSYHRPIYVIGLLEYGKSMITGYMCRKSGGDGE